MFSSKTCFVKTSLETTDLALSRKCGYSHKNLENAKKKRSSFKITTIPWKQPERERGVRLMRVCESRRSLLTKALAPPSSAPREPTPSSTGSPARGWPCAAQPRSEGLRQKRSSGVDGCSLRRVGQRERRARNPGRSREGQRAPLGEREKFRGQSTGTVPRKRNRDAGCWCQRKPGPLGGRP